MFCHALVWLQLISCPQIFKSPTESRREEWKEAIIAIITAKNTSKMNVCVWGGGLFVQLTLFTAVIYSRALSLHFQTLKTTFTALCLCFQVNVKLLLSRKGKSGSLLGKVLRTRAAFRPESPARNQKAAAESGLVRSDDDNDDDAAEAPAHQKADLSVVNSYCG